MDALPEIPHRLPGDVGEQWFGMTYVIVSSRFSDLVHGSAHLPLRPHSSPRETMSHRVTTASDARNAEKCYDFGMPPQTKDQYIEEIHSFFREVYGWMFLGLLVSGVVAFTVGTHPSLYGPLFINSPLFIFIILFELALVVGLISFIKRMTAEVAVCLFFLYCFTTGLTLSVIFLVYELPSIGQMFFISAGMFGVMSAYGYYTKRDLTGLGNVLMMGLFGIIIAGIINLFLRNSMVDFITAAIGVVVFTGLTAYDTQKIRSQNILGNDGTPEDTKESIIGALILYLDFVNLFLKMLRLFGKRRRS